MPPLSSASRRPAGPAWWLGWTLVLVAIAGGTWLALTRGTRAPVALHTTR